jgi:hypothetical protein
LLMCVMQSDTQVNAERAGSAALSGTIVSMKNSTPNMQCFVSVQIPPGKLLSKE